MTTARDKWRYGIWGIQLGLVLLVGLFVAIGVNGLLSAQLVRATPDAAPVPDPDRDADDASGTNQSATASPNVLTWNRNLFNQNAEPQDAQPAAAPVEPDPGALTTDAAAVEEPVEALPPSPGGQPIETELDLTLLGTMVASDPRHSVGHVRTPQNEDLYVRPGDSVPGARVERVSREFVLLRNDERPEGPLEYLSLEGLDGMAAPAGRASRPVSTMSRNVMPVNPPTMAQPVPNRALLEVPPGTIRRQDNDVIIQGELLSKQLELNGNLAEAADMQPMGDGGEVLGMRLGEISDETMLGQMGLQSGDVIVTVGGESAADERTAATMFERLAESGELEVEIDRRGERQTIRLQVER